MGDYLELKLAEIRMGERRREAAAARLVQQIKANRRAGPPGVEVRVRRPVWRRLIGLARFGVPADRSV